MADLRYSKPKSILGRLIDRAIVRVYQWVNESHPWHQIGKWPGVGNLLALRVELREQNLHDTDGDLTVPKPGCPFHSGPDGTRKRTEEGTHNDLFYPAMGCRYSRLGRNMRTRIPVGVEKSLLDPDPFEISQKILQREPGTFYPARSLNLLAAAWIQFQVHDWFAHEREVLTKDDGDPANEGKAIKVPSAGDWKHGAAMVIPKTRPDPDNWPARSEWPDVRTENSSPPTGQSPAADKVVDASQYQPAGEKIRPPLNSRFPAFRNEDPQWWDGSQIYGETIAETYRLRTHPGTGVLEPGGKLYVDPKSHLLGLDPKTGIPLTGFNDNWWLGLEILHTLFAREHNYICDLLADREPHLTEQETFETARLITCALLAKIHTVEWTPGIIAHPSIQPALDANWMGLYGHFFGEKKARALAAWLPNGFVKDVLTGVPMSETDHHGAPYSLTEEFNAVYRLHPLIPDRVAVKRCGTNQEVGTYNMIDIAFKNSRTPFGAGAEMVDVIYSFGTANPGAVIAKNYPNFLRDLRLPNDPDTGREQVVDLAAIDLIRDRERGVPRYCEFRRQLRMPVPGTFKELAGLFDGTHRLAPEEQPLPNLEEELRRIYGGDLEAVDTMVGMFLEVPPQGFGFSDTAFRIFILMASRRLKSDRFFSEDYTEEFYTKTGLNHIAETGFRTLLTRHYPRLEAFIPKSANPFACWTTAQA